jgi:hypothetical protein
MKQPSDLIPRRASPSLKEKRDPAFEALTGSPGFRRFTRAIP